MNFEELLSFTDEHVYNKTGKRLKDIEILIIRGSWQGQNYEEIAETHGYTDKYLRQDVGPKLWKLLSEAFGEKVSKTNFRSALERHYRSDALSAKQSRPSLSPGSQQSAPHPSSVDRVPQEGSLEVSEVASSENQGINLHRDWGEAVDLPFFYGRHEEITTLSQWAVADRCRTVLLLGMGGIGKTSLSTKLAQQIQNEFEYVIWRSLRNAPPIKDLLTELVNFLSAQQEVLLPEALEPQISRVLHYLRQQRCLIVLDNVESILQGGVHAGGYIPGCEGYGYLFDQIGRIQHQSCLLLTSREKPKEIALLEGDLSAVRALHLKGLSSLEGQEFLKSKGCRNATEQELQEISEHYDGNPLALKIVASAVQELADGDMSEVLPTLRRGRFQFDDINDILKRQWERLSTVERQVMYWLAVNREPVSLSELQADVVSDSVSQQLLSTVQSLGRRSLIERGGKYWTLQPVVMEYVTNQLLKLLLDEIKTGQMSLMNVLPLIKVNVDDFIREAQNRMILEPLTKELQKYFKTSTLLQERLDMLLQSIQQEHDLKLGYAVGNLLNLYRSLNLNISGYDFSNLVIRQAFLQDIELHNVNFSQSEFINSSFTQTFGGILTIQFSPDGQMLATGSTNCEIQLWQVSDLQCLFTLQGHTNWVRHIAFDPMGATLASASDDGTVRVWDLSTRTCQCVLSEHHGNVYSVTFSPDGQVIASTSEDGSIRLWSVVDKTCLCVLEGHSALVVAACFAPCGTFLASGSFDKTIRIWDVQTGKCLRILTEHTSSVTRLNFSPDGQWLASPSCDRTTRIWRVANWQCVTLLEGHTEWIWGATWSPDNCLIATYGADCTTRIWDIRTGNCLYVLSGHKTQVWQAVFSPDGATISTCSEDQTIFLWDVQSGRRLITIMGYSNWVRPVVFSSGEKLFATGHKDRKLRVWASDTFELLQELTAHKTGVASLAFHPNGELLASGGMDAVVKIWDWQRGTCIAEFRSHSNEVWGLSFSPDGKILASSSFDQTIKLWCLENKRCLATLTGHQDRIPAIAFHPKGEILASGSDDATIKLWDLSSQSCYATLEGHSARVGAVAFSADGTKMVSASLDQTLKVWNLQSQTCLQTLQGHKNWIFSTVFFPNDQTVASAGSDQCIKIWDVQTGQCLKTLTGHRNWVWTVAVSPDDQMLVSASEDETIRIWDPQTGNCLKVLKPKRPYEEMRIADAIGLTQAQESMLRELGAL